MIEITPKEYLEFFDKACEKLKEILEYPSPQYSVKPIKDSYRKCLEVVSDSGAYFFEIIISKAHLGDNPCQNNDSFLDMQKVENRKCYFEIISIDVSDPILCEQIISPF